jgi:hypothetical protein
MTAKGIASDARHEQRRTDFVDLGPTMSGPVLPPYDVFVDEPGFNARWFASSATCSISWTGAHHALTSGRRNGSFSGGREGALPWGISSQ